MARWLVLAMVLIAVSPSEALYFTIARGEKRCFIEDLPETTAVVAKYRLEVFDEATKTYKSDSSTGVHITILSPEGEELMDKVYREAPGRFAFTSFSPGEHKICLSTESAWFSGEPLRIHLHIATAEGSNDYEAIRKKDQMDDLQLRVHQLLEQVEGIQKEQAYQRVREARFRDTTESTHWRVVYWSLVQLSILVVCGIWQMKHLNNFFRSKKLV